VRGCPGTSCGTPSTTTASSPSHCQTRTSPPSPTYGWLCTRGTGRRRARITRRFAVGGGDSACNKLPTLGRVVGGQLLTWGHLSRECDELVEAGRACCIKRWHQGCCTAAAKASKHLPTCLPTCLHLAHTRPPARPPATHAHSCTGVRGGSAHLRVRQPVWHPAAGPWRRHHRLVPQPVSASAAGGVCVAAAGWAGVRPLPIARHWSASTPSRLSCAASGTIRLRGFAVRQS